ncbi:MAG: hypothetical protein ACF788_00375, partial [Novipirellula sp. JB048]
SRHLTSVTIDEFSLGERAVELLTRMRRHELAIDSRESRELNLAFSTGNTLARVQQTASHSKRPAPRLKESIE